MQPVARRVAVIATGLPVALLAHAPGVARRADAAARLRHRAAAAPTMAKIVTAPFWLLIILRGVLYPAIGADNLDQSWGGPTLFGAWMTHLAVGIAALVVVSLVLAVAMPRAEQPAVDELGKRSGRRR